MAYTLQAIVGDATVLAANALSLPAVALPQGKVLVPLTAAVREQTGGIPSLPFVDDNDEAIPESLARLCKALSARGKIAYVEAEIWGGDGAQAFLFAEGGEIVLGPVVDLYAINMALRLLGVSAADGSDEFEALQLGRHRNTDGWL